jgi:hypothetical protein
MLEMKTTSNRRGPPNIKSGISQQPLVGSFPKCTCFSRQFVVGVETNFSVKQGLWLETQQQQNNISIEIKATLVSTKADQTTKQHFHRNKDNLSLD